MGNKKYTYEEVKEFIENNSDCKLISKEYINNKQKLVLMCGCKKENLFEISLTGFRASTYKCCKECLMIKKGALVSFTYKYVKDFIKSKGCKLISKEYKNARTKLKILCSKCKDEIYEINFDEFKRNEKYHCNKCSKAFIKSKGEIKIEEFLKTNGISFKPQHRFSNCRDVLPLPFDFYILNENILIEYDGEGHVRELYFSEKSKKYAKSDFEKTKKHDKIKTKYCKNNNIKLIRIPYTEFNNINQILTQSL